MKASRNSSSSLEFKIAGKSLYSLDLPVSPGWEAFPEPSVEVAPKRQRMEGVGACRAGREAFLCFSVFSFPSLYPAHPRAISRSALRRLPPQASQWSAGRTRSSLSWSK